MHTSHTPICDLRAQLYATLLLGYFDKGYFCPYIRRLNSKERRRASHARRRENFKAALHFCRPQHTTCSCLVLMYAHFVKFNGKCGEDEVRWEKGKFLAWTYVRTQGESFLLSHVATRPVIFQGGIVQWTREISTRWLSKTPFSCRNIFPTDKSIIDEKTLSK